jgi:anti-anti-sigma factor
MMAVEQTPQCWLRTELTWTGPGAVRIAVVGELDFGNADLLAEQVRATLSQHRPASMLMDLQRLEFIDLTGVQTLYELHVDAATVDCTLIIRHAPRTMRWILSVLGLDEVFAMPALRHRNAKPGS